MGRVSRTGNCCRVSRVLLLATTGPMAEEEDGGLEVARQLWGNADRYTGLIQSTAVRRPASRILAYWDSEELAAQSGINRSYLEPFLVAELLYI